MWVTCTYIFQPERSPLGLHSEDKKRLISSDSHLCSVADLWWLEDCFIIWNGNKIHIKRVINYALPLSPLLQPEREQKKKNKVRDYLHVNVQLTVDVGVWALKICYVTQKWAFLHRILIYDYTFCFINVLAETPLAAMIGWAQRK